MNIKMMLSMKRLTCNDLTNPNNKQLFFCKRLGNFIPLVLHNADCMAYQSGKRNCTNHACGNSDCGAKFSHVYNFKDFYHQLPSCLNCQANLS